MMRFLMPLILIGIGITVFFIFTVPFYNSENPASPGINELKAQVAAFDGALDNSKALENQRDKLTAKQNAIDPADLERLHRLLPGSIDNIRLILEIEKIAEPYGMALKDVKYNADVKKKESTNVGEEEMAQPVYEDVSSNKEYGVWDLEFSISGSYNNFLNFTRDLENNLRIVDIASIQFTSSAASGGPNSSSPVDSYTYNFKIKTYWLKD